jgi:hypothetical protein
MFFFAVISQVSCQIQENSYRNPQNPGSVAEVCEMVIRYNQVTLRLVEDQNITFNQEMIHQILRRNGRD